MPEQGNSTRDESSVAAYKTSRCGGYSAHGRCDKASKYRVRSTAGTRTVYCCGVHLAQVVKRFLHDWDLAAEVSLDVK